MFMSPKPGRPIAVVIEKTEGPGQIWVSLTPSALAALLAGETVVSGKYVSAKMVPEPVVTDAE